MLRRRMLRSLLRIMQRELRNRRPGAGHATLTPGAWRFGRTCKSAACFFPETPQIHRNWLAKSPNVTRLWQQRSRAFVTSERWKQIEALFEQTLELPETERGKFLEKRCNGDEELRREVESL